MSVYYSIKEHLRLSRESTDWVIPAYEVISIMRGSLSALAALELLGEAKLYSLHVNADGKRYDVEGSCIDQSFQTALRAMEVARDLDVVVDYSYNWRCGWSMYEIVGPFNLMEYMENPEGNDLTGIFYSMWNIADCADGPGMLVAYGENNGKSYNGTVEPSMVTEVPAGCWDNTDTVIIL